MRGISLDQRWARERNLNKGKLYSARTLLLQVRTDASTLLVEAQGLSQVEDIITKLLSSWKKYNPVSKGTYRARKLDKHNIPRSI